MYNQDSVNEINTALKKFIRRFVIATFVFLAILAAVCINWGTELDPYRLPVAVAYAAGVLYAVGAVFVWGVIGSRLKKYRNFVDDILAGLEHEIQGEFIKVDTTPTLDNDLELYQIEFRTKEDKENRLIYLDASKDISMMTEGEEAKLLIHGKYIKEVLT